MRLLRIGFFLCLMALLSACRSEPAAAVKSPSLSVSAAVSETRTLAQRVPAAGSVHAWEEMSLGVELSGQRVAEVLVEVGDTVVAQQPLLRLDGRSLAMELRQALAQLTQTQAQLTVAQTSMKRATELLQRGLMAARDRDEAWAAEAVAMANRQSAQAQLENAQLRVTFTTLHAPDAGLISWRGVQPGQIPMPGSELLRLIRQGRLEWRAELPERELIRIVPGASAVLRGPDGHEVTGTVRQIAPALDAANRTGLVYIDLPQPGALLAGMYAQGELRLGELQARTVPEQAVVERDGYRYVFVLISAEASQDAVVAQRRIETGARQDGVVQIISGLDDAERIAVQGAAFLSDGDRVKVVATPAAVAATAD